MEVRYGDATVNSESGDGEPEVRVLHEGRDMVPGGSLGLRRAQTGHECLRFRENLTTALIIVTCCG